MQQNTATTWVKIYAILDFIGAVFLLIGGLGLIFGGTFIAAILGTVSGGLLPEEQFVASIGAGALAVIGVLCLGLSFVYFSIARAVWARREGGRIGQIVLSVLGLFSFPIGTILGVFGIYLFAFEPNTKALFGSATKPIAAAPVKPTKKAAKKKK